MRFSTGLCAVTFRPSGSFNPDISVDNGREPLDYSDMPETLAEAHDILHDAPIILAKQAELLAKKVADDVVKEGVK